MHKELWPIQLALCIPDLVGLCQQVEDSGADSFAIKDMAGLLDL